MLLMTIIHGTGLVCIARVLRLKDERLKQRDFDAGAVLLLGCLGFLVFALHILEIWVFAAFYLVIAKFGSLEDALYYSASAYATLGRTADRFPEAWRLIGAIEALVGFVVIGWSTAFMVSTMSKMRH
ncbi:hypothetical protein [Sphingomonas parva]|uniref:hypothetical protein n=1 Tax=Sphingomonas parva TaxID=2555898 RepID=UPI001CDB9325|nr:hypothetical protein [Sphingomonas parva]